MRRRLSLSNKASQSFAAAAAKMIPIIFAGGVYVGKNSARGAECRIFVLAQKLCAQRSVSLFKRKPVFV